MVASLVAELGLEGVWAPMLRHVGSVVVAPGLSSTGSVVVDRVLSCSAASSWIFLDQGLNACLLLWPVDSLPLSPHGSPVGGVFNLDYQGLCYRKSRSVCLIK